MMPEIKGYIFSVIYGLLCIAIGLLLYKFGISKKFTRKAVHILVGFDWVILYAFMGASIHFLIVCLLFTALLLVTHLKKMLPAMSSDDDNAPGTVYYGVAMSVMAFISLFVPEMMIPFGVGVFCTSFGDGFAGLVGQLVPSRINPKIYKKKSLLGTLAGFLFSLVVALVFNAVFGMGLEVWECLLIALLSVELELIGAFGLDNILITLGTAFFTYALVNVELIYSFIIPIILTPVIIMLVIQKKALTRFGLVLAILLDVVISLTLGNFGFVLLAFFLIASVAIDKVKARRKMSDDITKRGDCRDEIQVIANGLVPMLLAVIYACTFNYVFVVAYVAVLAEAFADTAASGFGVYSRNTFDLFKWKKTRCGLSGGMSVAGTLASFIAPFVLSSISLLFGALDWKSTIFAALVAFLGVLFDSFLGSVFQIKYKCVVCDKLTEKEVHCDRITEKVTGFSFFDNDVVNIFSGLFSAIVAVALYVCIF